MQTQQNAVGKHYQEREIRMPTRTRSEQFSCIDVLTSIVLGLYLSSCYSYLLFHNLIEINTIAVAFTYSVSHDRA